MEYILIGDNDTKNIKKTILKNRGIKDIDTYLNLNSDSLYDYSLLDNINEGLELYKYAIENDSPIYMIVDCDVDGYASTGSLYHYTKNHLNHSNLVYIIQEEKKHGLTDEIVNELKTKEIGLIVLPDAGTNDIEQCKTLSEYGHKILILDHHQKELDNNYALIINNQTCNYPNKNLCGAGIVYKFLQALDDEFWISKSDNYIDLVAIANISDIMDLRECETKYLVDIGLKNINHPLMKSLINKQSFSIKNTEFPTITDVSFFVTPLINAMIRVGEQSDKQLLFKAFIMEYDEFEYLPRKSKKNPEPTLIMENIYDRVARLCFNAKSKQSKMQEKAVKEIVENFDKNNKQNSICFVNVSKLNNVPKVLTGLVAMDIANQYQKPCLILRKEDKNCNNNDIIFSGSARNINDGFVDDLKLELKNSNLFNSLKGNSNAFGASIVREHIPTAIEYFNKKFSNINILPKVDFVFQYQIDYKTIKNIYSMKNIFSSFIKEPLIVIENINVDLLSFDTYSNEKQNYWKFQIGEIEYIKFNVKKDDVMLNIDTFTYSSVILNVLGKTNINMFGGKATPQVIIEDYEIVNKE
jgi:single-stranded-DNA-specific exonuclease